jgi:NADPH:quinone reductase-like Zn-dependent oxidoreductase
MRTHRLERVGSIEGLVAVEEEIPSPAEGQVLVKVKASSLNFRDMAIVNGMYPAPPKPRAIPLSDAAGEVAEVGTGVTRFKVGDRVVNSYFPTWFGGPFDTMHEQYFIQHDGWLTEYKVVSAEALVAMPEHLSFEEAATLPCAGVTAWSALAGIGPGDTVLTQGTGGVSLFAVQLAKAFGAQVIATTSTSEKATRLRKLGADHVLNYRSSPDWGEQARALTNGRGVDRVIEVGGPETLAQSVAAVAIGGQVSLIGILAGVTGGLDFMTVFMSQAKFHPIAIGSRRSLEDMIRVLVQHRIQPVIDSVFPLDEAKTGWAHFADRQLFGKVVFKH